MSLENCSIDDILSSLNEKFQDFVFTYAVVEYLGNIPVFFIRGQFDEECLKNNWEKIVGYIGIQFQTSLEVEFEVWNIYLFFIMQTPIDDSLKYVIENDTFSSRKIVIDHLITDSEIINEHILNIDLVLGSIKSAMKPFEYDPVIWKFLKGKEAKKKITEEDRKAFTKIEQAIKKKKNENEN